MTGPARFDTGDAVVDAALTDLAATDPDAAQDAEAAFGAITWGQGLPDRRACAGCRNSSGTSCPPSSPYPPPSTTDIARALGVLFDRVGLPRYARAVPRPGHRRRAGRLRHRRARRRDHRLPRSPGRRRRRTTRHPRAADLGRDHGRRGTRRLLGARRPPRGRHRRRRLHPGRPGLAGHRRRNRPRTTSTVPRLDLGGDSYLHRIHTERRGRWADSRGPGRAASPRPCCRCSPIHHRCPPTPRTTWRRSAGSLRFRRRRRPLTANNTLNRALLTEACHRFDWLILGKQAPPENQLPEAPAPPRHPDPTRRDPPPAAADCGSPRADRTCSTPTPPPCGRR